MAIHLYTGLPGNGKTLNAVSSVKAWAESEGRPVYYYGISDVTLPWIKLDDPKLWFEVPTKAIVLIDEAQEIFRNRSVSSNPPEFVTKLETHRHLGIDLVLITQHPSFIDPHVRRLTNLHKHMVRIWGMEMSTIHQWREVRDNPDKNRKDSEQSKWAFDKSLYGTYKSADAHTMKRSIPKRALFLAALPVVFALLCYATYWILTKKVSPGAGVPGADVSAAAANYGRPGSGVAASGAQPVFDPLADAKRFAAMNTPRLAGLPHTAPKYDALTVPKRVPVPAMCVQRRAPTGQGVTCKCYTQQGTPMNVDPLMCVSFARDGFFQEFDADGERKETSIAQTSQARSTVSDAPPAGGGSVVSFGSIADEVKPSLLKR